MLHASVQTPLNADFAAFCPVNGLHHLLAVGTYQLDEGSQTRLGRLHVFNTDRQHMCATHSLTELHATDQPGIFGMDWLLDQPDNSKPSLALALADGCLQIVSMKEDASLEFCDQIHIDLESMVLSVDSSGNAAGSRMLAATTASCQAAIVQVQ